MLMGAEACLSQKDAIKEKYGKDASHVEDDGCFAPNILEQGSSKYGSRVQSGQLPVLVWPSNQDDFAFLNGWGKKSKEVYIKCFTICYALFSIFAFLNSWNLYNNSMK